MATFGTYSNTAGLQALSAALKRRQIAMSDARPLLTDLGRIVKEQKLRELRAGIGGDGKQFAPLKESTLKRRKGKGPPLSPMQERSRVQSRLQVRTYLNPIRVIQIWTGRDWEKILPFHIRGTRRMAKRDPTGLSLSTRRQIGAAVRAYFQRVLTS